MFEIIAGPMGGIIRFIYDNIAMQNYGIAIIIFTLLAKLVMLPLTVKQQLSMEKTKKFQPDIKAIKDKYKKNPEKQNVKIQKFYKENKINPAGGCLPMIVQLPIMISLYYAISQPLKYMAGKSTEAIDQLASLIPEGADKVGRMKDMRIISYYGNNAEALESVRHLISPDELFNMSFLGISLCDIPSSLFSDWMTPEIVGTNFLLLIVPIVAAGTAYISTKYTMGKNQAKPSDNKIQEGLQGPMAMMSPVLSGVISFTLPAGLGLYWIIGNVFQLGQQVFINKFILEEPKQKELKAIRRLLIKDEV